MEKEIYQGIFCSLFWNEKLSYVREEWKIAQCPLKDFQELNYSLLDFCIKNEVKNLIVDAFGAISLLPEGHHQWLENEFNITFGKKTKIEKIITIIPESLVTSISINKFFESIKKNRKNIFVLKMKSMEEAFHYLESQQKTIRRTLG
jgi:hypothetical protein